MPGRWTWTSCTYMSNRPLSILAKGLASWHLYSPVFPWYYMLYIAQISWVWPKTDCAGKSRSGLTGVLGSDKPDVALRMDPTSVQTRDKRKPNFSKVF